MELKELGVHCGAITTLSHGGGVQNAMLQFAGSKMKLIGSKHTTIAELCETAEKIRLKMGKYSLLFGNCQHFCNNFLSAYGFPTKSTTIGPNTSLEPDVIDNIFQVVIEDTGGEGHDGGVKG